MHNGYDWVLDKDQQPLLVERKQNPTMMETLEWLIKDYDDGSSVAMSVVSLREIINEYAALKEYATHKPGCYENSELCICGLDALLEERNDA